ncbi:putative 7-deoxyloganetin glucosyltransferase [Helianthus annuus]|uniref:Glycosyltransferase n=1 Tax=Helianthus annuus TaxID=4232 RepID=A0A251UV01_HELAN|nr:7-deoxyloganetin glucosyltransferase isoform X2 [Helianthus annuus]XP_022039680.1 7-deoxyloganetin glucosyltransferase isoform X1 [Helianthus annuus]KAF5807622.1 putative 7-deoxyloganetin glucosyltransferase [Helianthus annuus]
MGLDQEKKPHALCIPIPVQGHITPMLKLAKILHSKGFLITFVNTEFNHQRLLRSQGPDAVHGLPSFQFETIPDGLPPAQNLDATQEASILARAIEENFLGPFKTLVTKVNASYSPVTCIVADMLMGFTFAVASELGIPEFLLWTAGAGSLLCFDQYPYLLEKGLMPLKDSSYLLNGYLDTVLDTIPTMHGIRLKNIPPWITYINPGDEYMAQYFCLQLERAKAASAIFFNTFDELDRDILDAISAKFGPSYGIGPLNLLENKIVDNSVASFKSNLWKEEPECLKWLDLKEPSSVIYVNFGSITVMTSQQLVEFGWGLAKSNYPFLWIIRPDLVTGESAVLPPELLMEVGGRGLLAGWCPQDQVLSHPSIGGFLTHSGWNSTIESISSGVPMICWPFFADQQPNCWLGCNKWGIAMEIDNNVKSDEVQKLVIELMKGEKGNLMRKKVDELKKKAKEACAFPSGSSVVNLEKIINLMQTSSK